MIRPRSGNDQKHHVGRFSWEGSPEERSVPDKREVVEEALELLPLIGRGFRRTKQAAASPREAALAEAQASPGQIQLLHALGGGPLSVGKLSEELGVSPPAVSQMVNHLEGGGVVLRRHDPADRRVVLVDYAPGMRPVAERMIGRIRRRLAWTVERMTAEEAKAFLKGLNILAESFKEDI